MKTALGEYGTTDERTIRQMQRQWFLLAAIEVAPQMPEALYRVFEAAQANGTLSHPEWFDHTLGAPTHVLTEFFPAIAAVRTGILDWANRFHLVQDGLVPEWVLETGVLTISAWSRWCRDKRYLQLPHVGQALPSIDYSLKPPEAHWNPFYGTDRKQFEKEYTSRLEEYVRKRLDDIVAAAVSSLSVVKAREDVKPYHYTWAAQFQVAETPVEHIGTDRGVSSAAVHTAINKVLFSVGLTRRSSVKKQRRK